MTPPLDEDDLWRFNDAVVQEIWNEMGRQRITSLREVARRAGMTHTALNARMGIDRRTGKPVALNVRDLAALGDALGVEPVEWVRRAEVALGRVSEESPTLRAVAKEGDVEPEGTEFDS